MSAGKVGFVRLNRGPSEGGVPARSALTCASSRGRSPERLCIAGASKPDSGRVRWRNELRREGSAGTANWSGTGETSAAVPTHIGQRLRPPSAAMDYLGDKLSVAHSQMSGWVGNVRRSLHSTLGLLSGSAERMGRAEDGAVKRTSSLRSLASRSRESIRRFSMRSQQRLSLRRRTAPNTPTAVRKQHA